MSETIHLQLESLFLMHYKDWCLLSYSYLNDKEEAEEIVQDVCAKILLKKKQDEILNLKAYIVVAIKNSCLKKIKTQQKFTTLSETEVDTNASNLEDNKPSLEEQTGQLLKIIEKLPQPAQKIFLRCVVDGEKYQEVADALGISINTVKYHIKSAYKKIRGEMVEFSVVFLFLLKIYRK
ncbi:sigma-70 family RNA polymerase sigma factor [Flavobacterium sp. 7A]|uniref:sigma-70 family RNA polymerase sigma factor n=1 Tax=Flavobacterium sp. 7A TaxID=2940571 RepID=UPI002227C29F|nr:sigma-70 family RNA polymerase sigma factor [Flavobacterium sp. 7A]MCW2118817.1 RNA polymerase sigma-70 factor (ECF subfamily) [Flavobacterium sp. 7A]